MGRARPCQWLLWYLCGYFFILFYFAAIRLRCSCNPLPPPRSISARADRYPHYILRTSLTSGSMRSATIREHFAYLGSLMIVRHVYRRVSWRNIRQVSGFLVMSSCWSLLVVGTSHVQLSGYGDPVFRPGRNDSGLDFRAALFGTTLSSSRNTSRTHRDRKSQETERYNGQQIEGDP